MPASHFSLLARGMVGLLSAAFLFTGPATSATAQSPETFAGNSTAATPAESDASAPAQGVPTPGPTESVVTVKVGGDRRGQTDVTPLAGVTLQLYEGTRTTPTAPVAPGAWGTCVSDAAGNCSFTVPHTDLLAANFGARFWIQRTGTPPGWFGVTSPRVGALSAGMSPATYTFRTPLLVGGTTYYSSGTSASFMRATGMDDNSASGGIWQTSRSNPPPVRCGADVALVLDLSASVGSSLSNLQAAARQLVNSLVGTPSRVALYTFASNAPAPSSNNENRPLTAVSTMVGASRVNSWIDRTTVSGGDGGRSTNWDRGLAQVAGSADPYDLAVVVTAGDPTVYGSGLSNGPGNRTRFQEVESAVFSANAVKAEGTRIVAMGVGPGVAGDPANLQAISGTLVGSDFFQTADYEAAGDQLRALAIGTCSGSLSILKMVVPSSAASGSIEGAVPAGGWHLAGTATGGVTLSPGNGDTASSTGALSFNLTFPGGVHTASVTATETEQTGYDLVQVPAVNGSNATCLRLDTQVPVPVTNAGATGFTVTVSDEYPVSCRVYSRASGEAVRPPPKKTVAPSAPRAVWARAGDARASISWRKPARPGTSPITQYVVTAVPGGRTCATAATTCVITGLRNQQPYRFRVRAQSAAGLSPASALSVAVVPKPYVSIKVATRSKGGKLWVDVDPNRGKGYWRFVVQKRGAAGAWATNKGPFKTKGAQERRTVNLPKGTYRVVVLPAYGYQATTSKAVSLRK